MQGTIGILKFTDVDMFAVTFMPIEMKEATSVPRYNAKGIEELGKFIEAIGLSKDRCQAVTDELNVKRTANIIGIPVPDDVLRRFGLV